MNAVDIDAADNDAAEEPDHLHVNRANWDDRAVLHAQSDGYRLSAFDDQEHLSDVVSFDRGRLGDIRGLRTVHLQCHIGTDTISLARLGARVAGLDLSPESINQARQLALRAGAEVHWVVADVYDALSALGSLDGEEAAAATYDLVYTGIGALCWLPDIVGWAEVVAGLLRPGGRLFLREAHPLLWALDDPRPDGLLAVEHPYFETPEPSVWDESVSYVETSRPLQATITHTWNHGLGEIISALLGAGMRLTALEEHDTVPYAALGEQMVAVGGGEFRLIDRPERLPASYTLQAVKE